MLTERITKAVLFKREVYDEVEKDTSFTSSAWMIVAVISFLSALGTRAGVLPLGIFQYIAGVLVSTVFMVGGFALGCLVISWIGRSFFKADVTFEELVRTLGLAYVWQAVAFLGIVGAVSPALACITAPIQVAAAIMGLISWLIAAKEALDLEWGETLVCVIIGSIINGVIIGFATAVLALFGISASAAGELLRRGF